MARCGTTQRSGQWFGSFFFENRHFLSGAFAADDAGPFALDDLPEAKTMKGTSLRGTPSANSIWSTRRSTIEASEVPSSSVNAKVSATDSGSEIPHLAGR